MKFRQLVSAGGDDFYAITEDGELLCFTFATSALGHIFVSPVAVHREGVHRPAPGDFVEVKYVRGDKSFQWSRCRVLWLGETSFQHEGLHGVEIALFNHEGTSWRWPQ